MNPSILILLWTALLAQPAWASNTNKNLHDWQLTRLLQPHPREVARENAGQVYIYDGLTDKEVERALDTQFSRIQNMMFVGTVKTDTKGSAIVDPVTGQVQRDSSGCGSDAAAYSGDRGR